VQGLLFVAEPKHSAACSASACVTYRQAYRRAYGYMANFERGHVIVDVICCGIRFSSVISKNTAVRGPNSLVQESLGVVIVTAEGGGNSFVIKSALL
jgi:hypothetical protein